MTRKEEQTDSEFLSKEAENAVRSGTFIFSGIAVSSVLTGVASILVARILGPEDFGAYGLALLLPSILSSITGFGIGQALLKYGSNLSAKRNNAGLFTVIKRSYLLRLSIASAAAILGFFFADYFALYVLKRPNLTSMIRVSCIVIVFQALYWISFRSLKSVNRMSLGGLTQASQGVGKAILSIGLVMLGFGVWGAITGHIASYAIGAVLGTCFILGFIRKQKMKENELGADIPNIVEFLGFGIVIFITSLLSDAIIQYRLILMANSFSDTIIGNFNAAVNIAVFITGLGNSLIGILFPIVSRISQRLENEQLSQSFNLSLKYMSIAVLPMLAMTMLMSDEITLILYGASYDQSPTYLALLSTIPFLLFLGGGIQESFFYGTGKPLLATAIWGVYLILFLLLGPLFMQQFLLVGLIGGQFISRLVSCIVGLILGKVILKIKYQPGTFLRVGVCVLLSSFLMWLVTNLVLTMPLISLLIGAMTFATTYALFLPLAKAIDFADLDLLEKSFQPIPVLGKIANLILSFERYLLWHFTNVEKS
jgi:O-antigen/teichoic acid export membrane protein